MAWELKAKDRLRDFLDDAQGKNKKPTWIDESYWPSLNKIRGTGLRDREDRESESTRKNVNPFICVLPQKDLAKRFSWGKYLEELHKHLKGENEEYADFRSAQFWLSLEKFHEVQRKAEEDAEALGTPMLDDVQLMAIVAGVISRGRLYGVGLEAAHFIAKSNLTAVGLEPCFLDHKQ
ncbi:hypothetical protein M9H77_35849 [Catharanthus roseus]|uniref:Uncharacterized protein n=1 Tax=Catharanthus roseus TaxID=4058 RepID=A0ACB9ZRX5_CATRO|nr:hypothetical protein M9H77_35849 [Catharanthus roseus]